jgi:alpha-D-xyloside xylohydrolase
MSEAAVDHAMDATAMMDASAETVRIRVSDARGSLTVGTHGAHFVLADAQGAVLVRGLDEVPWLELGVRRGGASPTTFHDPRVLQQPGIRWVSPVAVRARGADGSILLADPVTETSATVRATVLSEGVYSLSIESDPSAVAMMRVSFSADAGPYIGFGERFRSTARGTVIPMQLHLGGTRSGTNETHVPVPFFVSPNGYGVFVRTRYAGAFDVGATNASAVRVTFEAPSLEFVFFVDPDPIKIIERFTRLSGLPRLPPYWAHGHMQWRNAWNSRDELIADARRLRAEGIPTTTIWIDNPWQRSYNDAVFDEGRFRDPPSMLRELQSMGYRVLVWHSPYLDAIDEDGVPTNPSEQLFAEWSERSQLVRFGDPPQVFVSPSNTGGPAGIRANGGIPDFTQPAVSALWADRLRPVIEMGVRAFKLDYGEDIVHELLGQRPQWRFAMHADDRTAPSWFSHWYHRAYRDALDRFAGGDGFLLVRASSWGGQSVCDLVWPGDLDNDFREADGIEVGGLPAAVSALIHLSASGFPSFASDTGGYRGGTPSKEVLIRWAEASALAPYMQLGGGGESHNPWQYDDETTAMYRELARLHDSLVPYFRTLALAASREGTPPVRALSLAFARDENARSDPYAYLLGDDLYAAPVVRAAVSQREVYFPAGTWVHWTTRVAYTGPLRVRVDAPLGRPMLFIRQGAVIPMLAEDVETLAETDDPTIVDASDRATILRARVIPGVERSITVADMSTIRASAVGAMARVQWQPGREANELRLQIDWRNRMGSNGSSPVSVRVENGDELVSASLGHVRAGVCDRCWAYDDATGELFVTVRGAVTLIAR